MFAAYAQPKDEKEEAEPDSVEAKLSFASFPSAVVKTSTSDLEEVKKSESSDESSSDERRKKRKKEKSKHSKHRSDSAERAKKKKKKKDKSKDRSKEKKHSSNTSVRTVEAVKIEEAPLIAKGTIFSNGLHLRPSQAFYVDRKGDRANYSSSNLYFKYVPRYFASTGALGLDDQLISKPKMKQRPPPRYFEKRAIKRLSKTPVIVRREPLSDRNALGIYDLSTVMYIQGQGIAESAEEKPMVDVEEDKMKRRNAEFNQKLKQEPQNVQLWLDFIEFQDSPEAQRLVTSVIPTATQEKQKKSLHRRALLERKISILDKAIEMNPKSVDLITAKMQLASEFWESGALQQEWKRLLFVHPNSIELWKKYLSFSANYLEGFSVHNVLKAYSSCIQKMIQMQQPSFSAHQRPDHLEEHMIDIITGLCLFLRRAGLTEKSVSFYQAVMEVALRRPQSALRSFWDSGAPRFGESPAATGTTGASPQLEPVHRLVFGTSLSDVEDEVVESGQPYSSVWRRIEEVRSLEQWQAWTPTAEDDECDDPERSVAFDDISPYVFSLEKTPAMNYRLVTGCLQSLGVPLYPASQVQVFWSPVTVADDLLYRSSNVPEIVRLGTVTPTAFNSTSYNSWIRQVVTDSMVHLSQPYKLELGIWWLNVERLRSREGAGTGAAWKETKRWVKSLLKTIATDDVVSTLLLYDAYAEIEYDAGHVDEASRVLKMVLSLHCSNPLLLSHGVVRDALLRTWFSYIDLLIRRGARDEALAHLVSLGAGSAFSVQVGAPTPAVLLKARRKFETLHRQVVDEPQDEDPVPIGLFNQPDFDADILGCCCYFACLTEGWASAHALADQWLERHRKADMEFAVGRRFDENFVKYHRRREYVFANLLRLLSDCSTWAKHFEPRRHHDTLCMALSEYPNSQQLLSLFIQSEEQCSTFSRLWNGLMATAKSKASDATTAAVAAWLALVKRGQTIQQDDELAVDAVHPGYFNKIHHLVEHCVGQVPGRNSALLWRILLRSAHLRADQQRCRAVFYRAVRDCPWSKDVLMDVVDCVPTLVKEVAALLQEKDLRLRFPLEELDVLLEPEPDLEQAGAATNINLVEDQDLTDDDKGAVQSSDDEAEDNLSEDYAAGEADCDE